MLSITGVGDAAERCDTGAISSAATSTDSGGERAIATAVCTFCAVPPACSSRFTVLRGGTGAVNIYVIQATSRPRRVGL